LVEREILLDEGRAAWVSARTLDDLCRLGAGFVDGLLAFFPGWAASSLDRESEAIAAHLAALNRAGFLTVASQPGSPPRASHDGALHEQRAFVCGFATQRVARSLASYDGSDARIVVATFRRGSRGGARLAVSRRGSAAHAFAGYCAFEEELECFAPCVSTEALRALERSTYVSALDLEWGREARLWSELARVLGSS